ncbi:MAG: penicillin acylase family protein, partial [Lutibacter sp.]
FMRLIKKIGIGFILLIIVFFIAIAVYFNSLKPNYAGKLKINHLNKSVSVYFDDYGIPHIYAQNELDAYTALGYVHAQDRLFQMELIRRIAPGKLSEILGNKLLKTDNFFAKSGIDEASELASKSIDKNGNIYKLIQAYLNGINDFLENGATPIEYTVIGIPKKPFTLKDVYNILGYMSFSFAQAQKTDPLLSVIQHKLGQNYVTDLGITPNPNTTLIKTNNKDIEHYEALVSQINEIMEQSPVPPFIGSNSWVVNGKKTKSGQVLFANDPHIAYAQPAVWYEAHIVTPKHEMYGYHLAGIPFPLLGHNRNYAYGLTMFENDDLDFYQEQTNPKNPNQYLTSTGYKNFEITHKTIKVKGEKDVELTIKKSAHGPIINDVIDQVNDNHPIAMSWIYTKLKNETLKALYNISHAKNMQQFKHGASLIKAPGLNVMYGDAKGNIAWWASAKLYKLNTNSNRKLILNGSSDEDDIKEYLDFSKNPMAENPSWNYVYSANNQPDTIANILYPGYYLPENRAKRIVQLIAPKNDFTKQDFAKMITDVTSAVDPEVVKSITPFINEKELNSLESEAWKVLKNWDGNNETNQIEPTIYNKFVYEYLKNTFKDELGDKLFQQFLKTHLSKKIIARFITKTSSVWWDNINTKKKENESDIIQNSFKSAISELKNQLGDNLNEWNWGKVLSLEHKHPLGSVSLLRKYFNIGPFPVNGAREVLNNRGFDYTESGFYQVLSGPSTRRIIDFSDVENSISILPTGESGNIFSKHYKDQAKMYISGKFRKMKMNEKEIKKVSTKLELLPNNE